MSRYVPSDYRGPNDRPRSPPPRFSDRRPSVPSTFNNRPYESARDGSTAPRGPRSQYEGARPAQGSGPPPVGGQSRSSYVPQLRDLPPLGSSDRDRGRPFKERDFERRDRAPTPPERSPPRLFRDSRDFPPRDADSGRGRRGSRDGPLSAGSTYPEAPPFSSTSFRGGFARGRGRGDFESRGGRGGRRTFDDRDLFRPARDRSPTPRWGRDLSRDSRDSDRRDERRFERRDDDRRADWVDREPRREQPPLRAEPRHPVASASAAAQRDQQPPGPHVDPGRLALLESTGAADPSMLRRGSTAQAGTGPRREQPETPHYLNGRAENVTNRYGPRGSSPPTQAPPVPAFTLSLAAPAPPQPATSAQAPSAPSSAKQPSSGTVASAAPTPRTADVSMSGPEEKPKPPADAPIAPKAQAQAQPPLKTQTSSPPPAAPKAPRAHDADANTHLGPRLHGVRSWDSIPSANNASNAPRASADTFAKPSWPSSIPPSPSTAQTTFPSLNQPVSPLAQQGRFADFNAPTGPRAARQSPALPSVSPRAQFTSPRAENIPAQGLQGPSRSQTPPPSAPSGPRNQSYSVSPKATTVNVPTGPRASRVPPTAPRGAPESAGQGFFRPQDRLGNQPWAPPGSRGVRWNQWKPGFQPFNEKAVPAKRDYNGDEKDKTGNDPMSKGDDSIPTRLDIPHEQRSQRPAKSPRLEAASPEKMDVDHHPIHQQRTNSVTSHSAKQSFIGQPIASDESEAEDSEEAEHTLSSEDEDELDAEDLTLFEAKFERQKRELEAQMVDLSAPEYRATTPLESIARLDRISMKDADRFKEREHDAKMDLDEPQVSDEQHVPPTTHSSGSADEPEIHTPHGDNDGDVEIEDGEEHKPVRRLRRQSPDAISLPYLLKDHGLAMATLDKTMMQPILDDDARGAIISNLAELDEERDEEEMAVEDSFAANYRKWREECEDLDRVREDQDSLERQQSLEPAPEPELPPTIPVNPILEGRRLHKFSSEYDIEKVLKESEETARIEQERQEREALKAQADLLKEAVPPDQLSPEDVRRAMFMDHNRYRVPSSLTIVFAYEPPRVNFTEYEQQVFIAAYKENPKRWGKIAAALPDPNKTYKDCIHHYYTNKWDGRFRDTRARKLKAGRGRGRGGKSAPRGRGTGAMADLSSTRVDDSSQPLSLTETGRPRRAAAPNHFGEKEAETKAALAGSSTAKKPPSAKQDGNEDGVPEKPGRRRKGAGEKPGRKPKASQQLATLAAAPAPGLSPGKHALHSFPAKDDTAKLEDARLLAGFQAGHAGMANVDNQIVYHHRDGFPQSIGTLQEEHERPKHTPSGQSAKTAPSSYWSVPEQSDFIKYIKYFGTDFAAIAAHMGTKTHIMIKNHYQRQIDNGNRPELEQDAMKANQRRARGEDMGPPPTPTPITKRRYDNPTPAAPRPLAPHVDAMEVDEPAKPNLQVSKHASPPQLQSQAKFSSPAQRTSVAAPIALPVAPTAIPQASHPSVTSAPPIQPQRFPPGPRLGFFSEQRVEPRQSAAPTVFRNQPTPPSAQVQPPERPPSGPPDQQYLRNLQANLQAERDKALRIQQEESQQERFDQIRRQAPIQQPAIQPSPRVAPLAPQVDRKPIFEDRVGTPQKAPTQPPPQPRHTFVGSPAYGPIASAPPPTMSSRATLIPSPTKKDVLRPDMGPLGPSPPPVPFSKPPEAPKRSNLFGILNSEPEEPRLAKRMSGGDSLAQPPQRTESPLPTGYSSTPSMGMAQPRGENYMQTAPPSTSLHRSSLPQPSSTPSQAPPPLKHESSNGAGGLPQPAKHDWSRSVFMSSAHGSPVPQPAAAFERDVRPYYHHAADQGRHRTALSQLNGAVRANPSPPPTMGSGPSHPHSRTPSYSGSGPSNPPPRDQRPAHPTHAQPPAHQQSQPLHNPFSQPPLMQAQNASHHMHNSSISSAGYPPLHHRSYSRDNAAIQEQQQMLQQRPTEHEWRRANDIRESERQRDAQFIAQRQEHERQQSQYGRGPAPTPPATLLTSGFGGPPSYMPQGPNMGIGLREQSMREGQAAAMQEEQRMQQETERRRLDVIREQQMEEIRRQEAALQGRHATPLNGFWAPPRR